MSCLAGKESAKGNGSIVRLAAADDLDRKSALGRVEYLVHGRPELAQLCIGHAAQGSGRAFVTADSRVAALPNLLAIGPNARTPLPSRLYSGQRPIWCCRSIRAKDSTPRALAAKIPGPWLLHSIDAHPFLGDNND
jgi:hypothetical protein